MSLKVLTAPNPALKIKAQPVTTFDDVLKAFLSDLVEKMYQDDGVGLAAPQVGISKQILVLDIKEDNGSILSSDIN